ncbi:hypothetical protein PCS_01802 [Desulfocurvibacter africanus PCS]|uniref:Protein NO VEIN C-terminal domain-containing protein n=1 Tax=Desulfocurvibacter africanus PCS TaxID=1262666 RepID=M5PSE0_DESAF|nr:hypothetical protein [Desulfocurvibacter africanus]EMG37292.1 hypothetical protein PCS_01802 [Desulfocurvibacter africanus PCS]
MKKITRDLRRVHRPSKPNPNRARGSRAKSRVMEMEGLWPRPLGKSMAILLWALKEMGKDIKKTSFDCLHIEKGARIDFRDPASIRADLGKISFVEIKTSSRLNLAPDFDRYFCSVTQSELDAGRQLGEQYVVLVYNLLTGARMWLTMAELMARAKTVTPCYSVRL